MVTTETTTEILHDLIAINNDRIAGYELAIKELKPSANDLLQLFSDMADESRYIKATLENALHEHGSEKHDHEGTTMSGKIYRVWMDVKATFSGHSRKAILENCEYGEDKALDAYQEALSEQDLPPHVRTLLIEQQRNLMVSHNRIKSLRNTEQ
jgi:uncharacterized protein (TIGR02284 family)